MAPPCATPRHPAPPCATPCHPVPPLPPCATPCHPVPPRATLCHPAPPRATPIHPVPPTVQLLQGFLSHSRCYFLRLTDRDVTTWRISRPKGFLILKSFLIFFFFLRPALSDSKVISKTKLLPSSGPSVRLKTLEHSEHRGAADHFIVAWNLFGGGHDCPQRSLLLQPPLQELGEDPAFLHCLFKALYSLCSFFKNKSLMAPTCRTC